MTAPFRIGRSADRPADGSPALRHAPRLLAGLLASARRPDPGRVATRRAFWVMSDLRLDLPSGPAAPEPPPDFDAVLVAGNVAEGLSNALRRLAAILDAPRRAKPVFVVPGNVEYRSEVPLVEALARGRETASELGLVLLSDDAARFGPAHGDGTVVIGATLWTDWELRASPEKGRARVVARTAWEDAGRIPLRRGRALTPLDTLAMHARSRAFVEDALTSTVIGSLGLPTGENACVDVALPGDVAVVLTCHAPTPLSLPPDWKGWDAEPYVAASLASEAAAATQAWGAPLLWAHGNVPRGADHRLGRTRIVANPVRGPFGDGRADPALVVAV